MSIDSNASIEITALDWVPDFARGYVRDIRPRSACEEIGLDYAEHLISAINRPADHFLFQPWGQVPVLKDGGIRLFESGAILLHLAEKDARLMPRNAQARARARSPGCSPPIIASSRCFSSWATSTSSRRKRSGRNCGGRA